MIKLVISRLISYQDVLADAGPNSSDRGGGGRWWGRLHPPGWCRTCPGLGWRTPGKSSLHGLQTLVRRTSSLPGPRAKLILINRCRFHIYFYQFQNFQRHNNSSSWILHVRIGVWWRYNWPQYISYLTTGEGWKGKEYGGWHRHLYHHQVYQASVFQNISLTSLKYSIYIFLDEH